MEYTDSTKRIAPFAIMIGAVLALNSCKKDDPIEPTDPNPTTPVEYEITGTSWTDISPTTYRITALATVESKMIATIMTFGQFHFSYNGSSFTNSAQQGSSFGTGVSYGIERIQKSGNTYYGTGKLGVGNVFAYDPSNASEPWSIVASVGGGVNAFVINNGNQIIGTSSSPFISSNQGGSFGQLGDGFDNDVRCLIEYNGQIIAGGDFVNSGSNVVNHVAQWNGSEWVAMDQGLDGYVLDFAIFNGNLVAVGGFNASGAGNSDCSKVAVWDGTSWTGLDGGLVSGQGNKCLVHSGELIIGGSFTGGGSISSPNVIKWTGSSWEALAGGVSGGVSEMTVFENQLYVANGLGVSPNFLYRLD